jgi:hypothetical protein
MVLRVLQKRNAYCRMVTIISAPARNKISTMEVCAHQTVIFVGICAYPAYIIRTLKTG